ncbi:MAG TPA: Na+/H+ antiporter NhaA [Deltaproteobacteria bacterium]|nr:Na+/H+ antiporter NhaA [Deltaproteobacteria bacterium]
MKFVLHSVKKMSKTETAGGIILLLVTISALFWANSPWSQSYFDLWHTSFNIGIGSWILDKPIHHWINDGLMAIFFFVVGLEIKREILAGELSSLRQAILPLAAAIGGMLVPASLYLLFNMGKSGAAGWGIPMATDIAFAIGVLTLMGKKIPLPLKIFLTALAIVDDLGAVLVIAFFYTSYISWANLGIGVLFLGLLMGANRAGIRHPLVYALLGIGGLWLAFLLSGVHATIAGVLAAFTIPARTRIDESEFLVRSQGFLKEFEKASSNKLAFKTSSQQAALSGLEESTEQVQPPLQRLEHALQPWVIFLILPLFALANAGVSLKGDLFTTMKHPVTMGIIVGLVIGKPVGIFLFSWLAVKTRVAVLPKNIGWKMIFGVACLGGIGFTMSLFISGLAFGESSLTSYSKIGILMASTLAGIIGWIFLRIGTSKNSFLGKMLR